MRLLLFALVAASLPAADRYAVTLRLPPSGLYAREEMEIEFRVEDTTKPDPLGGFTPLIRLAPAATIDMPQMPGMPRIEAIAHAEGIPGEYGIHPTFPHGGDYRLRVAIQPPGAESFVREFPLSVNDPDPKRKPAPARFTLDLTTEPRRPRAGQPVELRLRIRDRENPAAPVTSVEIMHERPMHLILVRRDLAHFAHEHPAQSDDDFRVSYTFPSGGDFRIFADVAPKGSGAQILTARIKVDGPEVPGRPPVETGVELRSPAVLPARQSTPVIFRLADTHDLEPYLGAAGHLILIHEDAETFVHSHPTQDAVTGGELQFLARLPKPGSYRGWLQFQRAGRVVTHTFQVRAGE